MLLYRPGEWAARVEGRDALLVQKLQTSWRMARIWILLGVLLGGWSCVPAGGSGTGGSGNPMADAAVSDAADAALPPPPDGTFDYDVMFLGDSNTQLRYFSVGQQYTAAGSTVTVNASQRLRFSELVADSNGLRIANEGVGGAMTQDYLQGGQHYARWHAATAATYVISFGLNDQRLGVSVADFRTQTEALIAEVKARQGRVVLLTSIGLGPKTGSWGASMNTTMQAYNDVYRALAQALQLPLVDVTAGGAQGDFTIRNTTPPTVDASGDAGQPASYFANVHYNLAGARYVAAQLAGVLPVRSGWLPDGKTAALSITIDDNMALDHVFWRELSGATGAHFTWFVISGRVQATRNGAATYHGIWDDFRLLAQQGHEIGSHSHSHDVAIADIRADVQQSLDVIAAEIGTAPKTFAYPDPSADTANRWKPVVEAMGLLATRGTVGKLATTKRNANSFSAAQNLNIDTLVASRGWAVVHFHNLSDAQKTMVNALVREALGKGVWVAPFGEVAARFPQ